ncbi:MAG: hypothetical protein PF630_03830, partial [Gammaproteobacteria bacterium]|nr:hypothetical protein [Gammaproteobacteria bacterium]
MLLTIRLFNRQVANKAIRVTPLSDAPNISRWSTRVKYRKPVFRWHLSAKSANQLMVLSKE